MIDLNKTYHNDAISFLESIDDNSIDLVLTDPAYESLAKWSGVGTTARMGMGRIGSGSDDKSKFFKTISNDDLLLVISEYYRVLKDGCHAYIFCDDETCDLIKDYVKTSDIWPSRKVSGVVVKPYKVLIWDKIYSGTGYSYRNSYENNLFLWKKKKKRLNDLGIRDVLQFPRVFHSHAFVPTQKPDELFELLVKQSTQEGDLVLDTFMGSGTTARACARFNRKWIGCDVALDHVDLANRPVQPVQKSFWGNE